MIFEIGSAISGAAPTLNTLIVGRAVCGLGAPGLYIGAINLLTVFTTIAERPLYMSFVGATWCLGTVLGPIIGGAFAESKASWRWAFYINLVVAAAAVPAYIFLIPSYCAAPGQTIRDRIRTIDFAGATLFLGASVCLAMGISFGGALYSWKSGQIIGLFTGTSILWTLFIIQQVWCTWTTKTNRLFPAQFLKSYEMCILFALVAGGISCVFLPVYFIPLYCQFVLGDSPLEAGIRLMPFVSILVFGALLNGGLLEKFPLYMPWFTFGGIIALIGAVLLSTLDLYSSIERLYGYSVISSFGAGLFVNLPFTVSQAKVPEEQVPAVNSFIGCGQISGITLCLSVANSIFLNIATSKIAHFLPAISRAEIQRAISGTGSTLFSQLDPVARTEVLGAIVSTINNVYVMVISSAVFVVILSFFLKKERLNLGGKSVQG
jgi:MFS family permease